MYPAGFTRETYGRAWELALLRVKRVCMFVTYGRAWELSLLIMRASLYVCHLRPSVGAQPANDEASLYVCHLRPSVGAQPTNDESEFVSLELALLRFRDGGG